jgi:hypothetical protein
MGGAKRGAWSLERGDWSAERGTQELLNVELRTSNVEFKAKARGLFQPSIDNKKEKKVTGALYLTSTATEMLLKGNLGKDG